MHIARSGRHVHSLRMAKDMAARRSSKGPWRNSALPSAVLFDLDMTLGIQIF